MYGSPGRRTRIYTTLILDRKLAHSGHYGSPVSDANGIYPSGMRHSHADLGSGVHKVRTEYTNQELDHGMLEVFFTLQIHRVDIRTVGTDHGKIGIHSADG
jgi:hypothetical protein